MSPHGSRATNDRVRRRLFGRRRAALRIEAGLTQREMAKRARLSHPVVIRAEKGMDLERESVRRLAAALGIPAAVYEEPAGALPSAQGRS